MKFSQTQPGGQKVPWLFTFLKIAALAACFGAVIFAQSGFSFQKEKSVHMAVAPDLVPHLVLGFKLLMSDLYWVRTIQELDFKESSAVDKGWVYQMLDTTTNLDPRYNMVYRLGAIVVSVVIHDKEGARLLLEKGVKNFPNDWIISYHAAYHYLYEIKDCKRAAELFHMAAENGAPPWLNALSSRLFNISGQYEIAKVVLTDALKKSDLQKEYRDAIQDRLNKLEESRRSGRVNDFARCEDFSDNLPVNKSKKK